VTPDIEALKTQLENIRVRYGEEAYKSAATDVARTFIAQGGELEKVMRETFAGVVDFDNLQKAEPTVLDSGNPILAAIRQQVPGIKTQAQFNAFMAGFDALRLTMDAIFTDNPGRYDDGRKALEAAFEVARKVTQISVKLAETPEAAVSKAAAEFKDPPRQFTEQSLQRELLAELANCKNLESLQSWYALTKESREQVVSQSLRNELFDEIRRKKESFSV